MASITYHKTPRQFQHTDGTKSVSLGRGLGFRAFDDGTDDEASQSAIFTPKTVLPSPYLKETPFSEISFSGLLLLVNDLAHRIFLDDPYMKDFGSVVSSYLGSGATFNVRECRDYCKLGVDGASERGVKVLVAKYPRIRPEKGALKHLSAIELELRALCHDPIREHPNIVKLLGLGWTRISPANQSVLPVLYLEFATEGNLDEFLKSHDVEMHQKVDICLGVAKGLQVLHHISTSGRNLHPKLADFGHSLVDYEDTSDVRLVGGTLPWNALEWEDFIKRDQLHKTDIYSFGLLVWSVILDGENPFGSDYQDRLDEIKDLKASDILVSRAAKSVDKYFDSRYGEDQSIPDACRFDLYLQSVVRIREVFEHTLVFNPQKRRLEEVIASLSIQNVWGFVPITKPNSVEALTYISRIQAKYRFLRLYRIPLVAKLELINSLIEIGNNPTLPTLVRADAYAQLCFSHLEGFGVKDNDKALGWAIKGANLGFGRLSGLVYRLHQACGREIEPDLKDKVKDWLFEAAKLGSEIAQADLKQLDSERYLEAREILQTKYQGTRLDMSPKCMKYPQSLENLESLMKAAKEVGVSGISGFVFSKAHDNLLQCMSGCGAPLDEYEQLLNYYGSHFNLDAINSGGDTALILATRSGHIGHVRILLNRGCNVTIANKSGQTALHWIIQFQGLGVVDELLGQFITRGAQLEAIAKAPYSFDDYYGVDKYGGTVLHWAVERNLLDVVDSLLSQGADRYQIYDHRTPIEVAVEKHYYQVLERLLKDATSPLRSVLIGESATNPSWYQWGSHPASESHANYALSSLPLSARMLNHGGNFVSSMQGTLKVLQDAGLHGFKTYSPFSTANSVRDESAMKYLISLGYKPTDPEHGRGQLLRVPIELGCYETFSLLLLSGLDPSTTPDLGITIGDCLQIAARSRNPNPLILRELIRKCSDIDEKAETGKTPFAEAVHARNFEYANQLLAAGANMNILMPQGNNSNQEATILNDLIVANSDLSLYPLQYLFETSRPFRDHMPSFVVRPNQNETALHLATKYNNESIFDYILSTFGSPQHVNCVNTAGDTPLHYAAFYGGLYAAKKLLEHGACMNQRTNDTAPTGNRTPLDLTECTYLPVFNNEDKRRDEEFFLSRISVRDFLLLNGAVHGNRIKPEVDQNLVSIAALNGHVRLMEKLIAENADLGQRNSLGNTPLHFACHKGESGIVRLLLKAGVDVNAVNNKKQTPLMLACVQGSKAVVKVLLDAKVEVNVMDDRGWTALYCAQICDKEDLYPLLRLAGAEAYIPRDILLEVVGNTYGKEMMEGLKESFTARSQS